MLGSSRIFLRLAGRCRYPPPVLSVVQTDGLFRHSNGSAAVAACLVRSGELLEESVSPLRNVECSTEAEWASVYYGLLLAQVNKEWSIGIENDCLGVVGQLLHGTYRTPRPYANHYKGKIIEAASAMDWCGIRWIPKEQNKADRLFRMK